MKKFQIEVGKYYRARISGVDVTVLVNVIGTRFADKYRRGGTYYHITNLRTGRNLTFQSASKFRLEVSESGVPV